MIVSNYEHGYHDEFGRTHVQVKTDRGYMTFSYDTLIQYYKVMKNKSESVEHPEHPYVGLSYIGTNDKKMTVEKVIQHFGFGDYWVVLAHDENRSSICWVLTEYGNSFYEKRFPLASAADWEKQLKEQVK